MAPNFTVITLDRPLAEARAAEFLDVLREFPAMNWTRDDLLMDLPGKWQVSLAAVDEVGALCGYSVNSLREDSLYVHLLFVRESRRGQGIGAALLSRTCELATKHFGVRCVRLRTTISWTDTVRFYLRNGFVVLNELRETQQYLLELPVRGTDA